MERNFDLLLIDLLRRWHGWASSPVRTDDTRLRDFDGLMSSLPPRQHAAATTMARNAHAGVRVWSSPRVDEASGRRAKARLLEALRADEARWFGARKVLLNERGNRIGESNPNATLSDHDVELLVQLREEKLPGSDKPMFSMQKLADKFECSKSAVRWYLNGGRRGQVAARMKEV